MAAMVSGPSPKTARAARLVLVPTLRPCHPQENCIGFGSMSLINPAACPKVPPKIACGDKAVAVPPW